MHKIEPHSHTILIVDDDDAFAKLTDLQLRRQGLEGRHATTLDAAIDALEDGGVAAVLLDWQLGEEDGIDAIPALRRLAPSVPVILVTAHSSTDLAVSAIRQGAFDFIVKPLEEARFVATILKAIEHHELEERVRNLEGAGTSSFAGLVGASAKMQTVFQIIQNVSPTEATVMIQGESGTGKELVARAIHSLSPRSKGAFVALNMAALPHELVESTLFGHERGAFTGADRKRVGACEEADGGTLFLDEITEMPLDLQSKLLRFLQERVYRRVGGDRDVVSQVRVLSATNRDPLNEVREGRLRSDLFYRLHVVPIELPPLRERTGDIPLLATAALLESSERHGKTFDSIDPAVIERLERCAWPGNVRQLYHLIERCIVLNQGPVLRPEMLPADLEEAQAPEALHESGEDLGANASPAESPVIFPLAELEKRAIEHALRVCDGSATEAARLLGVSPATVYRKVKSFGILLPSS
ncbi:MAG: sigma-54-dependent Fis family transcriptional regulator [Deltaproteobacteria bacterium]|jgi:two-component system repressor protein LuxO|nr:sigma-54-dependent Fis family transcriptional regulator [Deltaproteobacteria bacterium]